MRRLFTLILLVGLCGGAQGVDPPELRAFYAPSFDTNTQAKCDAIIANTLARHINAVFVQVRARGDALYYPNREDSTYRNPEPRGQLYALTPSDLDVLQYYIDRLHNASPPVEVHAWLTTYNTWNRSTPPASPVHVYNATPAWITENAAGVTYDYNNDAPLDPGIPAVQEYLYNIFLDIVRNYDIDGIHFDYIRLLSTDSGYDPVAKARFLADTGWNYDTQNSSGQLTEVYRAWRRDQIARLVQRITRQTHLEKPWCDVSAFIVNFTDSIENLGQGYNWWVAHGAIDVVHVSTYASTLSTNESRWNFSVGKLAANGDQYTRPLVAAVGDYLLVGPEPNYSDRVVTALRANARPADGFNFFAYSSLFVDGTPADEHANRLFNAGGPMDEWAPVPAIPHKTGEETVLPNPPASLSATLVAGVPRITFQRPSAAADGDLPVHYRVYRDTALPVKLYYSNMLMEWWDPASSRTSFSFDDTTAGAGTYYYAAVSYDDWNNRAVATSAGVTVTTGGEYIIETRAGGKNVADYSEIGVFSDSSSHSTAPGTTAGIGSRFALPGDANGRNDRARFTPSSLAGGTYNVYVTCFNFASANALNITVRISDNSGTRTSTYNLTAANAGNVWALVGTMNFTPGQGHYVEFDNTTQTNVGDSTNSRMNAAAVRFFRTDVTTKERKPPVTEPASSVTEVIVDSEPRSLNYDDENSSSAWQTTTFSPSGTLYNGSARYYAAANFPLDDYAVWVVDLPQSGYWAIDGWIRNEQTNLAQGAQYRFVDGTGAVRSVTTTQQTGSGGWTINVDGVPDVSAYYFKKGRVYVTLYGNTTGSQMVIADALRFRLLASEVPVWQSY